jgi:hypothetical protein
MRRIATDGWNSFWHFAFGVLSVQWGWGIAIFVAYQLLDPYGENLWIDLSEFVIGYGVMYAVNHALVV